MAWRLYDLISSRWYNDELYTSREDCIAAANHYMQAARAEGEVLELLAEHLDLSEAYDLLTEDDDA